MSVQAGRCPVCGYRLDADHVSVYCPECGWRPVLLDDERDDE